VPFCLFTDPEFPWIGLTELEAKERGTSCHLAKTLLSSGQRACLPTSFCGFQLAFPALYFACTSTGCRIELANAAFTMRPQGHMLPLDPMI